MAYEIIYRAKNPLELLIPIAPAYFSGSSLPAFKTWKDININDADKQIEKRI